MSGMPENRRDKVDLLRELKVVKLEGGWTYLLVGQNGESEEGTLYDSEDAARKAGEDHNAGTW